MKPTQYEIDDAFGDCRIKMVRQFFENFVTGMSPEQAQDELDEGFRNADAAKKILEELPE